MALLKTYTISTDVTAGEVLVSRLHTEILDSGDITNFVGLQKVEDSLMVYGDSFISETNVDTLVQNHEAESLIDYKVIKNNAIDKRTGELIGAGFTYSSKVFSLSQNAQLNLNGANQSRDELTYPVRFYTIDSLDFYDTVDATDLHNLYLTALSTKKSHIDSGGSLREDVNSKVDKAGVDTVTDNR